MTPPPVPARPSRVQFVSLACGAFVGILGICVLAGWQFDLPAWKSVLPGAVSMKPNTALAFVLAGFSLLLLSPSPVSSWRARAGWLLALLAALISAATLLEYLAGWNLALDEFLFRDAPNAVATGSPGRMALTTALNFLLLGLSLLLIDYEPRKGFRFAEALVLFPLLLSGVSLVEYVHGGPILLALPQYTRMALHTAVAFLLLAVGVLLARPARGFLGEIHGGLVHRMERRVYLALALSLAVLVVIGLISIHNANDSVARSQEVEHTLQVRTQLAGLLLTVQEMETGARGFLLTGDEQYLQPYHKALDEVATRYLSLQSLIADNPAQTARLRQLEPLLRARLEFAQRKVETRRARGFDAALALVAPGEQLMKSIRDIVDQMDAEEARLQAARGQEELDSVARMNLAILLGTGFALGVVAFAGFALHRDFLRRQRAEELLHQLNAESEERARALETANKELEAFTYSVSHDLRAPLRHVDGFSKILEEEFAPHLPAEGQRMIQRIRAGAQQAGHLVDDLLNLSRVSRRELKLQIVGLKTVVEAVVKDLAGELQGRDIEWRVGELPFLECDAALIKQVLLNLLSNAVKYTRPRPKALIEIGACEREGQPAVFVRDNGVGFSMKYADKLFGVFQRLHRAEDFEGTGVGLATVQRIVHKHGGRVWAEAELDKGATFSFTLGRRT